MDEKMAAWTYGRYGDPEVVDARACPHLALPHTDARDLFERLLNFGHKDGHAQYWVRVVSTKPWAREEEPYDYITDFAEADARRRTLQLWSRRFVHREQFGDYIAWGNEGPRRRFHVDQLHGMPLSQISGWWNVHTLDQLGIRWYESGEGDED